MQNFNEAITVTKKKTIRVYYEDGSQWLELMFGNRCEKIGGLDIFSLDNIYEVNILKERWGLGGKFQSDSILKPFKELHFCLTLFLQIYSVNGSEPYDQLAIGVWVLVWVCKHFVFIIFRRCYQQGIRHPHHFLFI